MDTPIVGFPENFDQTFFLYIKNKIFGNKVLTLLLKKRKTITFQTEIQKDIFSNKVALVKKLCLSIYLTF